MIEELLKIRDRLKNVTAADPLHKVIADLDQVIDNYAGGNLTLSTVGVARLNNEDEYTYVDPDRA